MIQRGKTQQLGVVTLSGDINGIYRDFVRIIMFVYTNNKG